MRREFEGNARVLVLEVQPAIFITVHAVKRPPQREKMTLIHSDSLRRAYISLTSSPVYSILSHAPSESSVSQFLPSYPLKISDYRRVELSGSLMPNLSCISTLLEMVETGNGTVTPVVSNLRIDPALVDGYLPFAHFFPSFFIRMLYLLHSLVKYIYMPICPHVLVYQETFAEATTVLLTNRTQC